VTLGRYALVVLLCVGGTLALVQTLLPMDTSSRWATVFGGALAAANALVAYVLVLWAESRPTSDFLRAVLGGMVGRMAVMLAAVLVAVLLLDLPRLPLTVSLLGYFVLLLAFELAVVHKRTSVPRAAR
jgi:cadmium resistance protein CadD (predicted permease)